MKHMALMASCSLAAFACMAPADDSGSAPVAAEAAPAKSIVDPKYRGKKNEDFITKLIEAHATAFKTKKTETKVEGSEEVVVTETQVPDGVSVEGLFKLAAINNLDVTKFREQMSSHGFAGRFRMTVANMLRAAARNRHGIYAPGESEPTWVEADAEWLKNSKPPAPVEATHNRDGSKIKKAKPVAESAPAAAPAEGEQAPA